MKAEELVAAIRARTRKCPRCGEPGKWLTDHHQLGQVCEACLKRHEEARGGLPPGIKL